MSKKIKRKQSKPNHWHAERLWSLGSLVRAWVSAFWVGVLSPGPKISRELLTPGILINENSHKGLHLYPTLSITQHPVQNTSQNRQDNNTNPIISRQIPQNIPPHTALPSRRKKKNSPSTTKMQAQVPANTKHTQTTGPIFLIDGRN